MKFRFYFSRFVAFTLISFALNGVAYVIFPPPSCWFIAAIWVNAFVLVFFGPDFLEIHK